MGCRWVWVYIGSRYGWVVWVWVGSRYGWVVWVWVGSRCGWVMWVGDVIWEGVIWVCGLKCIAWRGD